MKNGQEEQSPFTTGSVDWSVYLQKGVIIDLQIKRYRGTTTINYEELGINEDSSSELKRVLDSYMKPGEKLLIPPEIAGQLKSIETSARQNLKDCSFDCSAFSSQGKFVPYKAYADFKKTNQELKARFESIRDDFASDYDTIVGKVLTDYKILAESLYMQSHPNAKRPSSRYVKAFVDKIAEQIPPKDKIVEQFEYNTYLGKIPEYLINVIRKKNDIDERVMKIASTNQANVLPHSLNACPSDSGCPSDIETEIERDIEESLKTQSDSIVNGFITDIVMRLRTMAYEGSSQIIESIERNDGKLVGRASIKAHSLVEDLRKLNFYGDESIQRTADALAKALELGEGKTRGATDIKEIKAAAQNMNTWAENSLEEIKKKNQEKKAKEAATSKNPPAPRKKAPCKPAGTIPVKISIPKNPTPKRTIKNRS